MRLRRRRSSISGSVETESVSYQSRQRKRTRNIAMLGIYVGVLLAIGSLPAIGLELAVVCVAVFVTMIVHPIRVDDFVALVIIVIAQLVLAIGVVVGLLVQIFVLGPWVPIWLCVICLLCSGTSILSFRLAYHFGLQLRRPR